MDEVNYIVGDNDKEITDFISNGKTVVTIKKDENEKNNRFLFFITIDSIINFEFVKSYIIDEDILTKEDITNDILFKLFDCYEKIFFMNGFIKDDLNLSTNIEPDDKFPNSSFNNLSMEILLNFTKDEITGLYFDFEDFANEFFYSFTSWLKKEYYRVGIKLSFFFKGINELGSENSVFSTIVKSHNKLYEHDLILSSDIVDLMTIAPKSIELFEDYNPSYCYYFLNIEPLIEGYRILAYREVCPNFVNNNNCDKCSHIMCPVKFMLKKLEEYNDINEEEGYREILLN